MNNQENQFPQFNYGMPEVEEAHPQFAKAEVTGEQHPQFPQQEVVEPQPQFVQPLQQETTAPQTQFSQPQTQQETYPQFTQPKVEPEVQPRFAKSMQKEGDTPFEQIVTAPIKKEKQSKSKKEKVKKVKPEGDKEQKTKKTLIIVIASLLAFVMLIGGGVFYYFYAMSGSAPVTAARILDKISSAEKIEGRLTEGNIISKSGQETQTIKIDNAKYLFNRTVDKEKNRHMYVQAKLTLVKNGEEQPLSKNNVIAWTLRPNMKAEWSFLGQKGSYQTTGKEKESLEQFITKKNSDSQKNLSELRTFLLNGYRPTITVEGKKTTISMNKDDLEKIVRKIEDNVKTDQEKFKKLLAKINPEMDANGIIESCKNGELTKTVKEELFPHIQSFKLEFVFNETSDKEVVGKMTFQVKPTQDETKTTTELDIKTETTFTL